MSISPHIQAMDALAHSLNDHVGEWIPAWVLRNAILPFVDPGSLFTVVDSLRKNGHFIAGDSVRGYRSLAKSPVKLTDAQVMAVKALSEAGGSGSIQSRGAILAAGEILNVMPETWLRLMTVGLIEGDGPGRIRLVQSDTSMGACES